MADTVYPDKFKHLEVCIVFIDTVNRKDQVLLFQWIKTRNIPSPLSDYPTYFNCTLPAYSGYILRTTCHNAAHFFALVVSMLFHDNQFLCMLLSPAASFKCNSFMQYRLRFSIMNDIHKA
jgi:hypothetical protein